MHRRFGLILTHAYTGTASVQGTDWENFRKLVYWPFDEELMTWWTTDAAARGGAVIPPNDRSGAVHSEVLHCGSEKFVESSFHTNVLDPVARTAAHLNLILSLGDFICSHEYQASKTSVNNALGNLSSEDQRRLLPDAAAMTTDRLSLRMIGEMKADFGDSLSKAGRLSRPHMDILDKASSGGTTTYTLKAQPQAIPPNWYDTTELLSKWTGKLTVYIFGCDGTIH